MRATYRIIGVTVVSLLFVITTGTMQPVQAQNPFTSSFFLITVNGETHQTTLWEADSEAQTVQPIYVVPRTRAVSPRDDFPKDEVSVLDQAVADGHLFYLNADQPSISRYLERAWTLDSQRLLILERIEAFNVIDNASYGYYQFVLLNKLTREITNLHKLSFHDEIYVSWECSTQRGLAMGQVFPNPVFDQFAFTITSYGRCYYETKQPTAGYIVDFSEPLVQVTELPQADGLSWSPNGGYLAYFIRPACPVNEYTSLNILPVNPPTPLLVLRDEVQSCSNTMFVGWADNETVVYPWKPGSTSSEVPSEFFSHDITTNETSTVAQERILFNNRLFRLSDSEHTVLLGNQYNGELATVSTQDLSNIQPLSVGTNKVFYNSRFNQYLFTDLNEENATRINADLTTEMIDLAPFLENFPHERVFFIAPGYHAD